MERSRILNLLGVPSWCCRYEYEEEDDDDDLEYEYEEEDWEEK